MLATSAGPIVLSTPVLFPEFKASYGGYNFSRPAIMEL
jgi:hypothetical protein